MRLISDLHTHSAASDGQCSPAELVQMVNERGLNALALTDHDTTAGLEEAILAGKQVGIRVIPGVELSAKEYPTFHILGYGFSLGTTPLAELCRRMKVHRDERTERLLRFLKQKGIELTVSEVKGIAGSPVSNRTRR